MGTMSRTQIETEARIVTETETKLLEWKPERQIMTAHEVDDEGLKYGGSIEMRIDRFSEFVRAGKALWSETIYIGGLPWKIRTTIQARQSNNHNGQSPFKALKVHLSCNQWCTSKPWKCRAIIALRVMAQKEGVNDIILRDTKTFFNKGMNYFATYEFATCDMLLDPENGYMKNGTIILQAHVQPLSVKFMPGRHTVANDQLFSSSTHYPSNFVLIIQGKEVHVKKNYLGMHSPYFKEQFAKNKHAKRAILQDVDYFDFIELLAVIYPTAYPITADNVETITELAIKFDMADLLERCEVFLIENINKLDRAKTLLMAEWYSLANLQKKIIDQIKNIADIKAMKPEYDGLSDRTKRMLFDTICWPRLIFNLALEPKAMGITVNSAADILQGLASSACFPPDGALIVENKRIPIHKTHLAMYSEYFTSLFQGEFAERNMDEIVLEEVGYNEILELLLVIYPTDQSVTEKNVGVILKMADRFIMPVILARSKKVLEDSTGIRASRKLWLAQRYNLPDLQAQYAKKYKTISDVEKLRAEPEFGLLDGKTRVLILDSLTS